MKRRVIWNVATALAVIAAAGVSAASAADKVGTMPIPIKITLEATINQCTEPHLPESDCLRFCFPSLGEDACLQIVELWKSPVVSE